MGSWAKRIKITIDQSDITSALVDFPILIFLSASSGRLNDDVSFVFDEIGSDANRKRIAITKGDGITECYVEIEHWNHANEKAWLWVKVPSIASDVDTDIYLYYDNNHADNVAHVGIPSDAVVHNVWDGNFKLVTHMRDDPDNSHIRDSTVNANDGTKLGAGQPAVTAAGKIDDAQDFDGTDDLIDVGTANLATGAHTVDFWAYSSSEDAEAFLEFLLDSLGFISYQDALERVMCGHRGGCQPYTGAGTFPLNQWNHIALVYNGGGKSLAASYKIYINAVNEATTLPYGAIGSSFDRNYIGRERNAFGDNTIDEFRISNTARPAAWVKASYESGRDDLLDFGSEEVGFQEYTRFASAAIGFIGVSGRTVSFPRSSGGTISLTGIVSRKFTGERAGIGSIGVIGISGRTFIGERFASAAFSLSGISSRILAAFRSVAASFSLSGTAVRLMGVFRSVSAGLGVTGVANRTLQALRIASASLGMVGVSVRSWIGAREASVSLALTAVGAAYKDLAHYIRSAAATVGIVGTATRSWIGNRTSPASIIAVGVTNRVLHSLRVVSASINQSANTTRATILTRITPGAISVQSVSNRVLNSIRSTGATILSSAVSERTLNVIRSVPASTVLTAEGNRIYEGMRSAVATINVTALRYFRTRITRGITTLRFAAKGRILDLADKIKSLKLGRKGT